MNSPSREAMKKELIYNTNSDIIDDTSQISYQKPGGITAPPSASHSVKDE